jgi:hypothetical protein
MKQLKFACYLLISIIFFNACQKEYSIGSKAGIQSSIGSWQFKDSSTLFTGTMDSAYIDSSGGTKVLHLLGTSQNGNQNFQLLLYGNSFTTGSYKASLFQTTFLYSSGSSAIYQAGELIGEFIVNITTLTDSVITGNFSGSAINSSNHVVQLTQGNFTSAFTQYTINGGVSVGVLGDSSGNCKPVILNGKYTQGVVLDTSNTVQVQITVATPGTYSIATNNVNGVSFSNTGTFSTAGVKNITLSGGGTPMNSGSQNFTLAYGNSQCNFSINFGARASGTTGGEGGSCTPFNILGTYQQGVSLNSSNQVQVQLNVTTPGYYEIVTNLIDGISFSGTGTLTSTGAQIITLTGSGTPVSSGTQNYTVTFGTSSCTFNVNVLPAVITSGDYFPLTLNSNWSYNLEGGTSSDSIHSQLIGYSPTFGSNNYSTIALYQPPSSQALDSFYYRKPGGDYYEYVNFSKIIPFNQPVSGEFIFLKDNVASGSTWNSPNISGTIGGVNVSGYITMTVLAKAIPVSIGPFNFPDVIEMKYEYYIVGNPTALETDQRWFARNVGEIYNSSGSGGSNKNYDIAAFQVF